MYCYLTDEKKPLPDDLLKSIDENWSKFITWRPTKENATLCRLVKADGDSLTVAADVKYKDVVGLRWRRKIDPQTIPFQVVTALALVKTADNHLVLVPRDSGDWESSLECPGGFVRSSHLLNGQASITDFIEQRVREDMNLENEQIVSCVYISICDAKTILEYMCVYEITLTLNKEELLVLHPSFTIVPPEYTPEKQHHYTEQPLHLPSKDALRTALHESCKQQ